VPENKKCKELLKRNRRNHEQINRRNPLHMIAKPIRVRADNPQCLGATGNATLLGTDGFSLLFRLSRETPFQAIEI
jgi:hypothetical protein